MCGIAGIIHKNGKPVSMNSLRVMGRILRHRGPDDEGFFQNHDPACPSDGMRVGLCHRRLKILDLSDRGRQPMSNESGDLWMTFNGEIYNHVPIRETLMSRGHRFRSKTDAEVILHGYEEWGRACVRRFTGMWAFALWDERLNRLLLSRDRFGIKPLYYVHDRDDFLFASEIKALLGVRSEERRPNLQQIALYLAYGLTDCDSNTFYKNILSLPPACNLILTREGITTEKYWDLTAPSDMHQIHSSPGERAEKFRELMDNAVKNHLMGDVPVGACLSGGLDSSAIVSLASPYVPGMATYTSVFPGEGYDESPYALEISRRCGTRASWIRPDEEEFMDCLSKLMWHQDEPNQAYGMFPQWKVMERARGEVKVLLDGQGGDEVLGGYLYFLPHYLKTLLEDRLEGKKTFLWARKIIMDLFGPECAQFPENGNGEKIQYRKAVIHPDLRAGISMPVMDHQGPLDHHLDNVLYHSITRDTLPALLRCEDRMSMAFSIESRVPFLDHSLVEFCFRLPYSDKIHGGTTKVILRRAMSKRLPKAVLSRRDKMGFPAPFSRWVRGGLRGPVSDIIFSESSRQRGMIDLDAVRNRFEDHVQGRTDHAWEIWRWLSLEIWFREFIDGGSSTQSAEEAVT